jgi:hypothetical protein
MDTNTVLEIINMIDNQIADNKKRMSDKGFNIETPAQTELIKLKNHLQNSIDAELSAFESTLGQAE